MNVATASPFGSLYQSQQHPRGIVYPSRMSAGNTGYGHEWAAVSYDTLDKQVDVYIQQSFPFFQSVAGRLNILDLGGGSGHRAEAFAKMGCDVCLVDIGDQANTVLERNRNLGRDAIHFIRTDVRQLDTLGAHLSARPWDVINLRRVIHFLPWDDVTKLITFLPQLSHLDTHLALSFKPSNENENVTRAIKNKRRHNCACLYEHGTQNVFALLKKVGYEIVFWDEKRLPQRVCEVQIFAKMPATTKDSSLHVSPGG